MKQEIAAKPGNNKSDRRLAYLQNESCLVNLDGDYSYLSSGYYVSQDFENSLESIHPTCQEVLDAYVVPLALEKARLAGLAIPTYCITND